VIKQEELHFDVTDRDVFEKPLKIALAFTQDPEHRDQGDKPRESHKYLEGRLGQ
jgi:hypothetical protein